MDVLLPERLLEWLLERVLEWLLERVLERLRFGIWNKKLFELALVTDNPEFRRICLLKKKSRG